MKSRKRNQFGASNQRYQRAVVALVKRHGLDRLSLKQLEIIMECGMGVAVDLIELKKANSIFDPYLIFDQVRR